jgi:hypothetical protein
MRLNRRVVRGGVEPPTFRFSGALSRVETKPATRIHALLTGITAGQQWTETIVQPCRVMPRSSVLSVGILWDRRQSAELWGFCGPPVTAQGDSASLRRACRISAAVPPDYEP